MGADGLIMGLDIAGRTGVAEGKPGDIPHLYSVPFVLEDDDSASACFGRAVKWAATRFKEITPAGIWVEGVVPETALQGRTNFNASLIRVGLYGAIIGVARAKGIPVHPVNIGKYRKAFTGHGGLSGPDGKRLVNKQCKILGWNPPDLDASDAGGVWFFGCGKCDSLYQQSLKF
jgi:hypothetical protein